MTAPAPPPAAESPAGAPDLAGRVSALESGQQDLSGKLDRVLDVLGAGRDQAHQQAQQATERRLDAPGSMADEIRRQFEERDRAAAARAAADEQDAWRKDITAQVAGLAEKTPEPPPRRAEKFMGWR